MVYIVGIDDDGVIYMGICGQWSSYGDDHGAGPGGQWYSVAVGIGIGGDEINKICWSPGGGWLVGDDDWCRE